jgi:hypothetical protein
MKQKERIVIVILGIWTFVNCFLLLKGLNYKNPLRYSINEGGWYDTNYHFYKSDRFYPFTKIILNKKTVGSNYNFAFYDYTEFFVYVLGAWGLLIIYKFLSPRKG